MTEQVSETGLVVSEKLTRYTKFCPLTRSDRPAVHCITGTKLASSSFYCDFRGDNGQVYSSYALKDNALDAKKDLVAFYRTHLLTNIKQVAKDIHYTLFVVLRNLLLALLLRPKA
jgi:hypothetical protein